MKILAGKIGEGLTNVEVVPDTVYNGGAVYKAEINGTVIMCVLHRAEIACLFENYNENACNYTYHNKDIDFLGRCDRCKSNIKQP